MKKILFIFFLSTAFLFSLSIPQQILAAGTPSIFSYQGRLVDASGNLLGGSGTTYYFKFSIWDVATGGTQGTNQLWPASSPTAFTSTVRQGVFNVNIGDTANGYPDTLDLNFNRDEDLYLQVEVSSSGSSFETLDPRQRISSAPFARLSGAVSGTGQSSFGTTTPTSNAVVTIEATSTSAIPLFIRSIASQVADLFKIQDNSSNTLFVIDASGNVGVGTSTATRKMNVFKTDSSAQLRLSQTSALFGEFYVDSTGDLQVSSAGGNVRLQDENIWVCSGGSCGADDPVSNGNVIVETGVIFNNEFTLKQTDASTTIMYDSVGNSILEFDEGQ